MKVLIFGANGYVGRYVAVRLMSEGHEPVGFVRTLQAASTVRSLGADAMIGSLDDPGNYLPAVKSVDAVIWCAQLMHADEHRVISEILEALAGTSKYFIFTGGASLLSIRTDGDWLDATFAEDDEFVPRRQIAPRLKVERLVRVAAQQGIRSMCVRPPMIWGNGGSKVISDMFHSARRTGAVCYVGRGLNVYSNVHVEDLAAVYTLMLKQGTPGALYHAVSGELNYRSIAEAIARTLGVQTRSVTVEEAIQIWDRFTGPIVFSSCSRTRSPRARSELGWIPSPSRLDLFAECAHPVYASEGERALPAWVST